MPVRASAWRGDQSGRIDDRPARSRSRDRDGGGGNIEVIACSAARPIATRQVVDAGADKQGSRVRSAGVCGNRRGPQRNLVACQTWIDVDDVGIGIRIE